MDSWPRPEVPRLPDSKLDESLGLYDTASKKVVAATPDQLARMYVCGITPYDATHMGHAATYLAFDLVYRQWLDLGLDVRYTQNVTDVDDPLLERANATGEDWRELAQRETRLFADDMTALRILPPHDYVGAVESIDLVIAMIQRLEATDSVYRVDNDLYFRVHNDPRFGELSGYDVELMRTLFGERGGDPDRNGKANELDCLLWLAERSGEPAWPSPWGPGRPGWHIECAAIALANLGEAFDVQGGGSDLIFPHHEMSASQAQVDTGSPFAKTYVHAGMVAYQGEKMSKSLGNLVLVSKLRNAGTDPMAIRLALLANHYRGDWEWHDRDLAAAESRLRTWREAVSRPAAPPADDVREQVRQALRNDLDSPTALRVIDDWAAASGDDSNAGSQVAQTIDALLGVAL